MTETREDAVTQAQAGAPATEERGWYLYGITRRGVAAWVLAPGRDEGEPVQALDCGALAAIVRRVPLAQFSEDALRARHDDTAWFAEMAHRHNQVIAAIHQQQTILPAKFGSVYARAEDVQTAVAEAQEALLAQLERVEGCDEWAVHIYAARQAIAQRVSAEHPIIQQLQHDLATASPGRAYFLQCEVDEERAAVTDQALRALAQDGYDRLARWAVASQVTPPARPTSEDHDGIEVLRAAFLVQRTSADSFLAEVRSCVEGRDGVRCEYSGPWAPYSFAVPIEKETP